MTQFSSHHDVSLEKSIANANEFKKNDSDSLGHIYDIDNCVSWIKENGFQKVCLQFPDKLLPDATDVALEFERLLNFKVFVLGDTAYESCCVDYTAAEHINADAVIHFGESCFSRLEQKIPVLTVVEKKTIKDISKFKEILSRQFDGRDGPVYLVCDNPYRNLVDVLSVELGTSEIGPVKIVPIDSYVADFSDSRTVFIGTNGRSVINFYRRYKTSELFVCNPENLGNDFERFSEDSRVYKRHYYLIETIKDSKTVGIVVGTLSVKSYLEIIARIKRLCKIHAKKSYIISVGKPNAAKLANFPEIDVFCIVACPQNEIYSSRDFYKPVVTPFDVEAALNPGRHIDDPLVDRFDYNNILTLPLADDVGPNDRDSADVSLISGRVRVLYSNAGEKTVEPDDTSGTRQLAVRGDMSVVGAGAEHLSARSWRGLEPNLGADEPKLAVEGRKGLAKGYSNEH